MNYADEIDALFAELAPIVKVERLRDTGLLDSVPTSVILAAQVGVAAFPFLWKVFLVWLDRHANGRVSIKYRGKNGEEVTAEYSRLNRDEVEALLSNVPPSTPPELTESRALGIASPTEPNSPIRIEFQNESGKS